MNRPPTAANIVLGATGSGKTSLIRDLLRRRARGERWAVLLNDHGVTTLAGAPGVADGDITVREVGGCICCSARMAMRTAVIALLRGTRADRLIIEASAAAAPRLIMSVLAEPALASALDVRATIATAHPAQVTDARYAGSALYRHQMRAADVIVIGGQAISADERRTACTALADIASTGTAIIETSETVDLAMLDHMTARIGSRHTGWCRGST